jgi:arginine utilization regulatory protein
MDILSQCEIGAVLISDDNQILSVNEAGDRLLHGDGNLVGTALPEDAEPLLTESDAASYVNIVFDEYLCRCATPDLTDLPAHTRMVVFRLATNDACHDMLLSVLNGINEGIVLCDAKGRLYFYNDAATEIDSIVTGDVRGKHISEVYHMQDGHLLAIPQAIADKRPNPAVRQRYTTCFGKKVDIISNVSPIVQDGQVLGAFNVLEDWSTVSELQKKNIKLQDKLIEISSATDETKKKSALTAKYHFRDIIYISSAMDKVVARCRQIAQSDSSVMIYGETGTGKELLAQSIHNASHRSCGPFLAINCAAIPDNLLEALLFGTEKGAYTGAESRAGLFEQANGGTLLLDEINSMNTLLQSKLLRVLQDGMLRRVGGVKEIYSDVRVLSNTNSPPHQAIKENKLRRDLYYRLGVVNINIPPLRNHTEDIPLLSKSFIRWFNKKLQKTVQNIDRATLDIFYAYHWPGNVRELEHAIEHAMNIMPTDCSLVTPEYIPDHILEVADFDGSDERNTQENFSAIRNAAEHTEREMLSQVLLKNGGNISKSAKSIGISRQNLQYRIKRSGIDVKALLLE